jgi:putative copper export protein
VLSAVGLTGAYNWLRVKPTLGEYEGALRIRRSARVELAIGIAVLLITAILVATPTAMDMKM